MNNTRKVEFQQTDCFAGRISRDELANIVYEVANSPHAVGKTFEVRRDESDSGLLGNPDSNWGNKQLNIPQLLKKLVLDNDRSVNGMPPFPIANEPPLPPTEEQTKVGLNKND